MSVLPLLAVLACTTGDVNFVGVPLFDPPTPVIDNDFDDDGILDVHEGEGDSDDDGKPDFKDKDSDGDGIPDLLEAGDDDPLTFPIDTDLDGVPDFQDADADGNGIGDSVEAGADPGAPTDLDQDGEADFRDLDNDGDNILDVWELDFAGPTTVDSDGDSTPDFMDLDSDNDGLCDAWESGTTEYRDQPQDTDEDLVFDFRDADSDDDGLLDQDEASAGFACEQPYDTDGDGSWNSADADADGDGIDDVAELELHDTDPYNRDSDGDGQSDGAEVYAGSDPLDAEDYIDGVYIELAERTSQESVFRFEPRINYGDVGLLVDTTGSMSSTMKAVADRFEEIVIELSNTIEDLAFSVAQFDDYNHGSMGSSKDKPFWLRQQSTTDLKLVQKALDAYELHSGGDTQESTVEALYQASSGVGYDQSCNGTYDSSDDVPPFMANSNDAFNGSAADVIDTSTPGGGERGGMGFRKYALPILIYATDYYIRDPDWTANTALQATPGGCPIDAGHLDLVASLGDLGGYIIGLDVGPGTSSIAPYDQMLEYARLTGSVADLDGDGDATEELVFQLPQANSSFGEDLKKNIALAVDQLVKTITFERVEVEVVNDPYGLVQKVTPEFYENIDPDLEGTLDFEIDFLGTVPSQENDQVFTLTLNILGDRTVLLDTKDIVVVIPGK